MWTCETGTSLVNESSSNLRRAFFLFGGRSINAVIPLPAPAWEAPQPVLFNAWKHHGAALRRHIRATIDGDPPALDALARNLVVAGTELMDLYLGALTPREIGEGVLAALRADNLLSLVAYRAGVEANGGYRMLTLADDASQWVLRMGDEADRWVHVHPARWAPQTCRVKANVLKTAVMVLAYTGVHGGEPMDVALVNQVRRDYLKLAPLGHNLASDQGIGQTINVLRNPDGV